MYIYIYMYTYLYSYVFLFIYTYGWRAPFSAGSACPPSRTWSTLRPIPLRLLKPQISQKVINY